MRADRLLALCDYVEKNVPDEAFDFSVWKKRKHPCGTIGCMLGHAPFAFPDQWGFDEISNPVLNLYNGSGDIELSSVVYSVMRFFEIDYMDYGYLFEPRGSGLGEHATKSEVIANIREWVAEQIGVDCPMCDGVGKIQVQSEKVKQGELT